MFKFPEVIKFLKFYYINCTDHLSKLTTNLQTSIVKSVECEFINGLKKTGVFIYTISVFETVVTSITLIFIKLTHNRHTTITYDLKVC